MERVNAAIMGTSPVHERYASHFKEGQKVMVKVSVKASDSKG